MYTINFARQIFGNKVFCQMFVISMGAYCIPDLFYTAMKINFWPSSKNTLTDCFF
jgi:hypothetical protein